MSQLSALWTKYWSFSISPSSEYIQGWFPLGLTGPCCPRDSQESSLAPQFKSINPSMLSLFYGPTLTSTHDHWKTTALTIWTFAGKVYLPFNMLSRLITAFSSMEQVSFNFMAAVGIRSNFGAQENKICHCFHFFPIYLPWSDRTGCYDLSFLNVELADWKFKKSSF